MVLSALVSSPGPARAATPAFPLHTSGRFIVDSNGARVRLNGVNWYGAESTDFVVDGLQAATLQSIVQQIKSLGFNVVRLPLSNQLVETNPVVGNYALTANPLMEGENALTILDQVIAALTNAGIMVILDNHMSDAGWCCSTTDGNMLWYNANYPQANWISDWQTIAQRYENNQLVIGADLRNEPRSPATWGGSAANDWHAAAQLGGDAVLSVNPNLLIFVEGINYAGDLSGVTSLPVSLNVANHLVYEAHDYGFWYTGLAGYNDWYGKINPKWGFLVTGSNPQPLWIGEFGTCNSASTCVNSANNADLGYWFNMSTAFAQDYSVDWTYWALNGTTEGGHAGGFGSVEGYGVLNTSWNASADSDLSTRLQQTMGGAAANFSLVGSGSAVTVAPGGSVAAQVAIVPGNGFTGTVNLACTVGALSGGASAPTCSVPSSVSVTSNAAVTATVSLVTSGAAKNVVPLRGKGVAALACGLLLVGSFTRRGRRLLLPVVILIVSIGLAGFDGCGGGGAANGGGGGSTGTTAGNYTVTVTGSATGVSPVSLQIALTVQ